MSKTVVFSVYLKGSYTPSELEGNAVVSYSRPTGKHYKPSDFLKSNIQS